MTHFFVRPLDAAVLMHNLMTCPDRTSGADYLLEQIIQELNARRYSFKREIIEAALYCCNLNNEAGKFWHPQKIAFTTFVYHLGLDNKTKFKFNLKYNLIEEEADASKT